MENALRKTNRIALACLLLLCASSHAGARHQGGESDWPLLLLKPRAEFRAACAEATEHQNPVLSGDYPDPSIVRTGRDYWATATSGGWAPHFPILHSRDLVNWYPAGYVFRRRPSWAKSDFWAPEITHDRGRFLIFYTARRDEGLGRRGTLCVAVATSRHPAGPYTDHGPLVCQEAGSIDGFFIRDERGRPFLVWKEDGNDRNQPTPIWAQMLTEDATRLVGKPTELFRNDAAWERHVVEGSYVMRRGGWFYQFYSGNACCGRDCNYALGVARARKLFGPWEKNPSNPILRGNERWRCPGHGSIVTTPGGRDYLLYHAYDRTHGALSYGREGLLDEVVWGSDGWPAINDGKGPSESTPAPLGVANRAREPDFHDDFGSSRLALDWQWPVFSDMAARVETHGDGRLVLTARKSVAQTAPLDALIARRVTTSSYVATALLDPRGLSARASAGLAAYGWPDGAVGISVGRGRVFVWRRHDRKRETLASAAAPGADTIRLRMTVEDGARYSFAYSADGHSWNEMGGSVDGSFLEVTRLALTVGGADGAAAIFDWVRLSASRRA